MPDLQHQKHCGPVTDPVGTGWISVVYETLRAATRDEHGEQSALNRVYEAYQQVEHGFRTAFEDHQRVDKLNWLTRFLKPMLEVRAMAHRRCGTWA